MKKAIITLFVLSVFISGVLAQDEMKARQFGEAGLNYYNNGQFSSAIDAFKKGLRLEPTDSRFRDSLVGAYESRAEVYLKQGDKERAANDLRSILFYFKYYNDGLPADQAGVNSTTNSLNGILRSIKAETTPLGHFQKGVSLRAQGEFAAAAYEFFQVVNDKTYRLKALENIADIFKISGNDNKALALYEKATQAAPNNASLHYKFASLLDANGQVDYANSEYNKAMSQGASSQNIMLSLERMYKERINKNPNDARLYANLGAVLQKKGDTQGALNQYLKAQSIDNNDLTTKFNLASLYTTQNNIKAALQTYDSILSIAPNNTQAHFYKAEMLRNAGSYVSALAEYKSVLALDPNNQIAMDEIQRISKENLKGPELLDYLFSQATKNPENFDDQYALAYELHKQKRYDEAKNAYNKALALKPEQSEIYVNLAQISIAQNDEQGAIALLDTGLAKRPNDSKILKYKNSIVQSKAGNLYAQATDLFNAGKYAQALDLYRQIPIQTPEVLYNIGASYYELNDKQQAINAFKASLAKAPRNTDTLYYLATAYLDLDDKNNAKYYYNEALKVNPNHKNAKEALLALKREDIGKLLDQALAAIDKKDYKGANDLLNKVQAIDPNDSYSYYYRGMIYDDAKNYMAAAGQYWKATSLDSNFALAYYALASDYDLLKKYPDALKNYQKFIQLSGTNVDEYTKYAQERIKELKK